MGVVSPVAVYDDGSWCSLVTTTPSQRPANKEDSRSLLNTGKAAPGRVFVLFFAALRLDWGLVRCRVA